MSARGAARDAIRYAIEQGHRPLGVPELAAALGKPRKTLDRHLSLASPLTARDLIAWGRVVSIAIALDDAETTVAQASPVLRFTSTSALRNLLQRRMALTPTSLRLSGGTSEVLARIRTGLTSPRRT